MFKLLFIRVLVPMYECVNFCSVVPNACVHGIVYECTCVHVFVCMYTFRHTRRVYTNSLCMHTSCMYVYVYVYLSLLFIQVRNPDCPDDPGLYSANKQQLSSTHTYTHMKVQNIIYTHTSCVPSSTCTDTHQYFPPICTHMCVCI